MSCRVHRIGNRLWKVAHLVDSRNLNTLNNLSLHLLSAILPKCCLILPDLPVINLAQKRHHLSVQHGGKEIRMQRRVSETLLEAVALVISTLGVDFRESKLIFGRVIVPERPVECTVYVDLEGQ